VEAKAEAAEKGPAMTAEIIPFPHPPAVAADPSEAEMGGGLLTIAKLLTLSRQIDRFREPAAALGCPVPTDTYDAALEIGAHLTLAAVRFSELRRQLTPPPPPRGRRKRRPTAPAA
jgi:hypothetical protein